MEVRGVVLVERKLDGTLVARSGVQFAAGGLVLDVLVGDIALVVVVGQHARAAVSSQVDDEGLARSVVFGLKDDVDLVVVSQQHRNGGVLGRDGLNRRKEGGGGIAALLEVAGAELLAVDRQTIESGLGVGVEATLGLEQLDLGHSDAGLRVRKRHVLVGEGEPHKRSERGLKVIGIRRDTSILGADSLGCSDLAPSLAILGHLNLGGACIGIARCPVVVNKVHDGTTQTLLRIVVKRDARGLIALLGIVVVGPAALIGAAAGSMGGNAIVDGRKRIGLLALGHALRNAHKCAAVSDVVADGDLLVLNANRSGNSQILTKDIGGALDGHSAGLVVSTLGRSFPLNGEARIKDGAVGHSGRTRIGERCGGTDRSRSGVVQKRRDLIKHGYGARDLGTLDLAGNLEGARLGESVLVDVVPSNVLLLGRAVRVVDVNLLGQGKLAARLYIVETGVEQARNRLGSSRIAGTRRGDRHRLGSETVSGHGNGDVATLAVGAHNAHQLTSPGVAVVVAVGLMVGGATVVDTGELACATDLKLHVVLGVGNDVAVLVLDAHGDISQVALARKIGTIDRSVELGGSTGGRHALTAIPVLGRDNVTALVIGLGGNGAIGIRNIPAEPEVLGRLTALALTLIDLIGVASSGGLLGKRLLALRLRSRGTLRRKEELNTGGVGVDNDLDLAAVVLRDHAALPSGKDMQRVQAVVPLALIQIERILGQTGGIDDAKVGVLRRDAPVATLDAGSNAVPRGGLAQVVEAGPDILAGNKVASDGVIPCLGSRVAPAHVRRVIGGELVSARIGHAAERVINATAVNGRDGLRTVELPRRIVAMQLIIPAAVGVIDTDQTTSVGEVVGMIIPRATLELVVAKRHGTRGVGLFGPLDKVELSSLVKRLGAAGDHLVTHGPHNDRGRVKVTGDGRLKIELGPDLIGLGADDLGVADLLIEETSVVEAVAVLRIGPAVEDLLVEQDTLLLAHLNEHARRRVVRRADGVAAHLLQDTHLALDSRTAIDGTQGTLILMHADALELDILAVEGEAVGDVVVKPAVTEHRVIRVDDLAINLDLGANRVQVGSLGGPEARVGSADLRLDSLGLACSDSLSVGGHGADGLLDLATLREDGLHERHVGVLVTIINNGGRELGGHVATVLALELRSAHVDTVPGHRNLVGHHEVDIAADARAGVPTAGRNLMVDLDGDGILLARLEVRGEVEGEGGVAVGMVAQLGAVNPNSGIHVDAIEIDTDLLAGKSLIDIEALTIPADTARLIGALGLEVGRIVLIDAVVMRKRDVLPRRVIERAGLSAAGVAQVEFPVVVKRNRTLRRIAHVAHISDLGRRTHLSLRLRAQLGRNIARCPRLGYGKGERSRRKCRRAHRPPCPPNYTTVTYHGSSAPF